MNDSRAAPHERILATATRLFLEHGIQAVGVSRIIAEAEVAQMTPYRQFGGKDQVVAATLEQWSAQWLHWLYDRLDRCGDDPMARFAGLWTALEEWLATDGRHGSLIANAAVELRGEPDHPAQAVIAAHRMAVRQLLEDLAKPAGAEDPADLAAQLHVLLDGVVAGAVADRQPARAPRVGTLADAALRAAR